jgi:uncharacterized protein (DUF58 family)/transglutaminase-like putative cysteine protease
MILQEGPQRSIKLKSRLLPGLVIVLLGLQLVFPFKGWGILLSGFGGLWLLSYLWARSLMNGLQIEREMRFGWKQVGDRLRERILLRNSGWAPSLWVEIDDHSDMNEYDISSVSDVKGHRHRSWYTQGYCDTRGLYTLGPVTLHAQDPFGVYNVEVDYTNSAVMMVAPPVIALPEIEIASGGRVGEGRSSNKGVEQTISTIGVREYVPGDSLRYLHWPTVARQGDLYVHLFDNEPSSDWWVLLDMDAETQFGDGARSTVEHGVILAASLVNRGIQQGKNVGLVSYGDDLVWHPPDIGNSHLWTILRSLAAIHPGGPSLDQILLRLRSSLDQNTSLVIITANLSTEWINALELLKRSGIVPTVLILDPVSFGGSGSVETFRSRLHKLGITGYTISADLLEQPKKRPQGLRWLIEQTRLRGESPGKWASRWQRTGRLLRTWGVIFIFFYLMGTLLGSAIRGLETDLVLYLIGGGIVVGWLLARSPLPGWAAGGLSALIGGSITMLWVGRLGPPLVRALEKASIVLGEVYANLFQEGEPVDYSHLQLEVAEIWENVSGLVGRLWEWTLAIFRGMSYYDPVAITILWGVLAWGVVTWAMWYIFRRKQPLLAFIPSISLVAVALALGGHTSQNLAFMFGATIALMAFVDHDDQERRWLRERLTFADTIRSRIVSVAIPLTLGLIVFALVTPSIPFDFVTNFAQKLVGTAPSSPELVQSLGIEGRASSEEANILDLRGEGGLPNQHLIGSGSKLSEQVVMVVRVDASRSGLPEEQLAEALSPLYLRSLVYDRYLGTSWASRDTDTVDYAPGDLIPSAEEKARPVRQQVQIVEDQDGLMYTLGTPLSVDQDFRVAWRLQNEEFGIYDIFGAIVDGETYRADSLVQIHSIDELRAAGQNYPNWMISRYMSLPERVPERVLTLARDLTATETNPYDRAVAIENYLRQFPYNLNVSTGPVGVDIVDYLLFRLQQGYCDYYASAMVVLARAAGMPARYVAGYIGEHYDESLDAYVITGDQAHAWAEIYFPGYGWIQFEPTGGRPAIERPPEALPELPEDFELDFSPLVEEKPFSSDNASLIFWLVLLLVVILTLAGWHISDWWLARMPVEKRLPRLYHRLFRYGRWMKLPTKPGVTPFEFSYFLSQHLAELASGSFWADWLMEGEAIIRHLTAAYVRITFNPSSARVMIAFKIMRDYKKLRLRLWVLWFLGRVYRIWFLRPFFWIEAPLYISSFIEEEQ